MDSLLTRFGGPLKMIFSWGMQFNHAVRRVLIIRHQTLPGTVRWLTRDRFIQRAGAFARDRLTFDRGFQE
jgi:hypothetical protein